MRIFHLVEADWNGSSLAPRMGGYYFIIIFLFTFGAGVKSSPLLLRPIIGLLYQLWGFERKADGQALQENALSKSIKMKSGYSNSRRNM
jgi:hypothetical protein